MFAIEHYLTEAQATTIFLIGVVFVGGGAITWMVLDLCHLLLKRWLRKRNREEEAN